MTELEWATQNPNGDWYIIPPLDEEDIENAKAALMAVSEPETED